MTNGHRREQCKRVWFNRQDFSVCKCEKNRIYLAYEQFWRMYEIFVRISPLQHYRAGQTHWFPAAPLARQKYRDFQHDHNLRVAKSKFLQNLESYGEIKDSRFHAYIEFSVRLVESFPGKHDKFQ